MITLRYKEDGESYEPTLEELAERAYENPEYVHCEVCDESIEYAEAGVVRYSHAGLWGIAMLDWLKRHHDHLGSCKIKKGPLPKE